MSILRIITSSSLSSLDFSALYSRFFLVSHPCTVLADEAFSSKGETVTGSFFSIISSISK
jgi:hypothetical protein